MISFYAREIGHIRLLMGDWKASYARWRMDSFLCSWENEQLRMLMGEWTASYAHGRIDIFLWSWESGQLLILMGD
jgi:hypothetical protein